MASGFIDWSFWRWRQAVRESSCGWRREMRKALIRIAAASALLWVATALGQSFTGLASVRNDGTLVVDGRAIRLYGIYIPPTEESCRTFERPPKCAPRAVLALDFKIAGFVRCEPMARNEDGTLSALCRSEGTDLSAYLLERGWALALPDAPFEYVALERIARSRGFGVWGLSLEPRRPAK
jgi:endonuclease YncB( thermonuclease family)